MNNNNNNNNNIKYDIINIYILNIKWINLPGIILL